MVERRKAERKHVFQPPVEDKTKLSSVGSGRAEHNARSSVQQGPGSEVEGSDNDIDVLAIKKRVSKALEKV